MAIGPGKYDALCTTAREAVHARAVILVIIDGAEGSGFSVQSDLLTLARLPDILEHVARDIRAQRRSGL